MKISQFLFECKETNSNNSNYTEEIDILDDCSTYIGFGSEIGAYSILALSILGFLINIIFLIFQHLRIRRKKKNSQRKISMRKLFQMLPLFDCITSLYWIISSLHFVQARDIQNNKNFCSCLSIFYLVCFTFQFVMINCLLIHFRKINLNPMQGILKPNRNVLAYIIISLAIGISVGFLGILFDAIGRSPMNTCFVNTKQNDKGGLFFLVPILFILIAIVQIFIDLCCRGMFITDKGIRKIHKKNSTYVLIFCFLHFPMIILFLQTLIQEKGGIEIGDDIYKIYSFCITLLTSMIPLIIGIIRYFQGLTKIECINDMIKNNRISKIRKTATLSYKKTQSISNTNLSMYNDPYEWLENHVMECFMRDILIGVASGLKKSKDYGNELGYEDIGKSMDYEKYIIDQKKFAELQLDDDTVSESDYLYINVINYAPKSFAYLRQLENIDIDKMIESFLPRNNTQGLKKSQGKSGSFFISTDDNKYMIKSLKSDEIDLIRNGFLNKYIKHIEETKNQSLLCRLYGMFNIILAQGDEILIIVMRNVIGELKDNTVVKFDLKGSTYKRKADIETTDLNSGVMKDLNFNEIERNIMINQENIDKIRNIISLDSKFLSDSGLMDYSLFLVKITLNKEEAAHIFGKNIKQDQDNALKKLFSGKISSNDINKIENNISSNDKDKSNNDIIEEEEDVSILKIDDNKGNETENIQDVKYYKQYLYPSLNEGVGYIISIIDYFQYFNFYKVFEAGVISKFKTGLKKANNNTVSCVDPKTYSERFINYVNQLTDISQIIETTPVPLQEIQEEKNEDENENKNIELERFNSEDKNKIDIYNEDNDNLYKNDEVRITINDPKVKFSLRITVMNKDKYRQTNFGFKNSNKFTE